MENILHSAEKVSRNPAIFRIIRSTQLVFDTLYLSTHFFILMKIECESQEIRNLERTGSSYSRVDKLD